MTTPFHYDHKFKTWPEPFEAMIDRLKAFEIRVWDRDGDPPKAGDRILLNEYDPESKQYTGRSFLVQVSYVTYLMKWVPDVPSNVLIMGLDVWRGKVMLKRPGEAA